MKKIRLTVREKENEKIKIKNIEWYGVLTRVEIVEYNYLSLGYRIKNCKNEMVRDINLDNFLSIRQMEETI